MNSGTSAIMVMYRQTKGRECGFMAHFSPNPKEIVERRHGEPIKFLFLPKMGLLGSQAGNEKTAGCEL